MYPLSVRNCKSEFNWFCSAFSSLIYVMYLLYACMYVFISIYTFVCHVLDNEYGRGKKTANKHNGDESPLVSCYCHLLDGNRTA